MDDKLAGFPRPRTQPPPATRTPAPRPHHLPPRPESSSPLATTALSLPLAITHSAPPIPPQPHLPLPVRPRSARVSVPARPLVHHPAVCLRTVTAPSTPPSTPAPVHGMVRGFCSYRPKATMVSRLAGILPSRARANPGNAAARHSARTISARHERTQRVAHGENSRTNSPRARPNPVLLVGGGRRGRQPSAEGWRARSQGWGRDGTTERRPGRQQGVARRLSAGQQTAAVGRQRRPRRGGAGPGARRPRRPPHGAGGVRRLRAHRPSGAARTLRLRSSRRQGAGGRVHDFARGMAAAPATGARQVSRTSAPRHARTRRTCRPRSARAPLSARPVIHRPANYPKTATAPSTPPSTSPAVHAMVQGLSS